MSLIGIPVMILICYALSSNRKAINWRLVAIGIALQGLFAALILRTGPGKAFFEMMNNVIVTILDFTREGARFVFGNLADAGAEKGIGFCFATQVLPTIIFFSSLMTILYYLGIMQRIISVIARVMQKTMKTSGAESLSAAANIFVGQTEAPLVIKPYVARMTISELNCVMVGGMATIAGGVMAAYVGMMQKNFPDIAGHLMAASVMSAPAALVFAKIMVPETEVAETAGSCELKVEQIDQNVIDAAARGASEGMGLAINVAAMLIAFIALIALGNSAWQLVCKGITGASGLDLSAINSLEKLMGWVNAPIAWLMGVAKQDLLVAGQLLGEKTVLNEFVAYAHLGDITNGTFIRDGVPVVLQRRTWIILTYACCGFANFGSIGIQLGGIGGLAPNRRGDLAKLGIKALVAATFASYQTANIAGLLVE
ncbi:Na+ dependent nucleoside transporter domain-containing protein [bacterium CG2_30_54_10]|nr:MAG: Na+ dependent nucleoside transporter domain-containing protein [bacterium CG2_30_54_10]